MEKKRFSLDMKESAKWAEILQLIFGMICIIVSVFLVINISESATSEQSSLTGIYFLIIFGIYQIWAGFGYSKKYIEIGNVSIRLKLNSIGRSKDISYSDIEKIEFYPLNIIFRLNNNSKINLRFGISNPERNEEIINQLSLFAEENKVLFEQKD
jgi:hypothetical protein